MDASTVLIIVGAVVAGFVQGLSGFAFSLVALSFWAWAIDPRLAGAMAVFGGLTGQIVAALTVRRRFEFRLLMPFLAGGLAGIPLGMWILPWLNVDLFKALLGALLVIWCPAMLMAQRLPRLGERARPGDALAGVLGGIMGGMGGFSGTVPTLWCTLRGFDKDAQRAVVQNFNLAMLSVTMAAYLWTGMVTREMLPMFALVGAAMLIPSLLGARLYIGISGAAFRKLVLSLLTASGLALLASSLPRLLA